MSKIWKKSSPIRVTLSPPINRSYAHNMVQKYVVPSVESETESETYRSYAYILVYMHTYVVPIIVESETACWKYAREIILFFNSPESETSRLLKVPVNQAMWLGQEASTNNLTFTLHYYYWACHPTMYAA